MAGIDSRSTVSNIRSIAPIEEIKVEKTRHQSPALNLENLEKVKSRNMSLTVMGHQKDVKENAYSQVSARIKYQDKEALDLKSIQSLRNESKSAMKCDHPSKVGVKNDKER